MGGLKKSKCYLYIIIIFQVILIDFISDVNANNLVISNVSLQDRYPPQKVVKIQFDITWDHSWRNKINHDAVWLTVRLFDPLQVPVHKRLCSLTTAGLNPEDVSPGTHKGLEIFIPEDRKGVFVRRAQFSSVETIDSQGVRLSVDYSSCGFAENDQIQAQIFGIEMVYIPEGAFFAGDHAISTASLKEGSLDTDPWSIRSEAALTIADVPENGYYYVSNNSPDEDPTGARFILPDEFPKGYHPFYVMKYEITEGQWVEFVNSLGDQLQRLARDLTNPVHKNSDTVQYRQTLSCSGSPLLCTSLRPHRAVSYLTWMDLAAFLDWASLRPITELEFEKMARGPRLAVAGEFAWGSTPIESARVISDGEENGTEFIINTGANGHYNNTVLSGGDTVLGSEHSQGPLRTGIFATASSNRITAGAGYYGVMELSGNLAERLVTLGNVGGRLFTGRHGDGYLTLTGNANEPGWPGMDVVPVNGVTGDTGSGLRGGSWEDTDTGRLHLSDRAFAANPAAGLRTSSGRGGRSYDGD